MEVVMVLLLLLIPLRLGGGGSQVLPLSIEEPPVLERRGLSCLALILYTQTLDKLRSIALLKLIGARNTVILGLILQQALLLGGLGYAIAFERGAGVIVVTHDHRSVDVFDTVYEMEDGVLRPAVAAT